MRARHCRKKRHSPNKRNLKTTVVNKPDDLAVICDTENIHTPVCGLLSENPSNDRLNCNTNFGSLDCSQMTTTVCSKYNDPKSNSNFHETLIFEDSISGPCAANLYTDNSQPCRLNLRNQEAIHMLPNTSAEVAVQVALNKQQDYEDIMEVNQKT